MTWNTQDTNLSWYLPKAIVDHTINGQGTANSTLDNSATTQDDNSKETPNITTNNVNIDYVPNNGTFHLDIEDFLELTMNSIMIYILIILL